LHKKRNMGKVISSHW